MAACMRRQPAASLLDLRSVVQHSADRGPLHETKSRVSLDAHNVHYTEATSWPNQAH